MSDYRPHLSYGADDIQAVKDTPTTQDVPKDDNATAALADLSEAVEAVTDTAQRNALRQAVDRLIVEQGLLSRDNDSGTVAALRKAATKYHRDHFCGYCGDNMDGSETRCQLAEVLTDTAAAATAEREAIENELAERIRLNLHRDNEISQYRCEHPNQHKSAWQCTQQARALLSSPHETTELDRNHDTG